MQRSSLLRVHRGVPVVLGGLMIEVGCLWLWHVSPKLTSIYNAEYTREFFLAFSWLARFADVDPFADAPSSVLWVMVGLLLMTAGYLLALVAWRNGVASWLVIGFAAAFRLTMALLPGLFSTDVFSYVMYGRIAAVHGQNPYVTPPSAFAEDPFVTWVFPFWRDQPSVYGPLWTDLSQALSSVTADWSPFAQVQAYRAVIIGFETIGVVALWWLLRRFGGDRPRLWLLYAWNPLVVFDLVGATHNDALMLSLLLVGLACMSQRRAVGSVAGFGLVALSALVKFTTALVVPLAAVAWAGRSRDRSQLIARLGVGLGLPLALAIAFWLPWLASAAPLLDAAGGRLSTNSAPDVLALSFPDQELARFWIRLLARGAFALWFGWEVLRLWRRRGPLDGAFAASARLLLGLPLLVLNWVWSWYFSWSLVLAVLGGRRCSRLTRLAAAYTLVALPVVYAHQYLNEQLSPAWVLVMAVAPLIMVLPIRRAGAARKFFKTGGTQAMNLRTLPTAWGITIVRLMAGIIIFWASVEKFQAGGPATFSQTPALAAFPAPMFWGTFITLLEGIGGALLILGLGARWVAILFTIEYFGTGLWIKTHSAPPFGGWDSMRIDLMLLAAAVTIVLVGPGRFALENVLLRRAQRRASPMTERAATT